MENRTDKIQSEFDQKLKASELSQNTTDSDRLKAEATASRTGQPLRDTEATARAESEPDIIPVVEEQVHVGKKTIEKASVRVSKDVHEKEVAVDLPTIHEEVNVERIPVNEYVDTPPPPVRYEGDVTIIPVLQEELVVVKRLKVVEELHITKRRVETHESKNILLRKEEVNVNRVDLDQNNPGRT